MLSAAPRPDPALLTRIPPSPLHRDTSNPSELSASRMVADSKGSKKSRVFPKTANPTENGPACRVYGTMEVKKVTGNLHITTLGHGYLSWEHTDHALMNLSHVIHEFSFGPYFPRITQPLDNSASVPSAARARARSSSANRPLLPRVREITEAHFHIFQYFLSVVSTTYIDAGRRLLSTSSYSVTDMSRVTEHGRGVPGIFFKYDIEPMSLTIRERTTSLVQFLVRLAGIVGGILVCSDFGFRTVSWSLDRWAGQLRGAKGAIPTSVKSPRPETPKTPGAGYRII